MSYKRGIIDLDIMSNLFGLRLLWNLKLEPIKHRYTVLDDNLRHQLKGLMRLYFKTQPQLMQEYLHEVRIN